MHAGASHKFVFAELLAIYKLLNALGGMHGEEWHKPALAPQAASSTQLAACRSLHNSHLHVARFASHGQTPPPFHY